jgi:hypothetical protein
MEASTQAAEKRTECTPITESLTVVRPGQFGPGGRDPVLAGRKGGSRPKGSKALRTAIRNVLASSDGQSNAWLARIELEREKARGRELYARDRELAELDLALYDVQTQLDEARDELRRLDAELAEREAQLQAARDGDPVALADVLRAAGEQRVEVALGQLGWLEDADAAP